MFSFITRAKVVTELAAFEQKTFKEPVRPSQLNCSLYAAAGERHYLGQEYLVMIAHFLVCSVC